MINIVMVSALEQFNAEISAKAEADAAAEAARENAKASAMTNSTNNTAVVNQPTATSNMTTIQDDMGNTITFDRSNPNPESSAAFSTQSTNVVTNDSNSSNNQIWDDSGNPVPGATAPSIQPDAAPSQSSIDQAVANSGDTTFSSSALTNNPELGNLSNSVNSSLGGVTDTGKMFSSATDAAGATASKELGGVLNSIPGDQLSNVMKGIPGVGSLPSIASLSAGGNLAGLASKLSQGMSPTAVQGLVTSVGMSSLANAAKGVGQVSSFMSVGDKIGDAGAYAKNLATSAAANSGLPSTVSVNGTSVTEQPPARPMDIVQKAAGTPMTVIPPEARTAANNIQAAMKTMGTSAHNDEQADGAARGPGMPTNGIPQPFGAVRDARAVVPGMEALMFDISPSSLGKFTSLLPPLFKSLLPIGAVAGLVSKGPISLGGLTQLIGGAALGAVASQALRSVGTGSQGLSSVSGMSGLLGAQALSRTVGSGGIPVNIASTFGNAMLGRAAGSAVGNLSSNILGTDPSTTAMISNVVGVVSTVALNKNIAGIPVSSQVLGLAANVALKSAGVPVGIPTSVLGTASSFASNPLSSLVGTLVSGRVPIIPTNLSIGNVGALSGITQNLQSLGLAENIIPRSQLGGLLPPNLSSQINSSVPPRMRGTPGYNNPIEDKNKAATTKPSDAELQPQTGSESPAKPALLQGQINGQIPYGSKISKHFTLGQLSNAAIFKHPIVAQNGLSVDQIIAGLSWIATNILDALIDGGKGGFTLNSGFRGPGGSNPTGDHGRGAAVDIQWGNDRKKHHDMAVWVRQNGIPAGLVILEKPGSANWLHLAGGTGHPTARFPKTGFKNQTWYGSGYLDGFLMP